MAKSGESTNRYQQLLSKIFFDRYSKKATSLPFSRADLEDAAREMKIPLPKNSGDVINSARYRTPMPEKILKTQPEGKEWIIESRGRSYYQFSLVPINRIRPSLDRLAIKIPEATPGIIEAYAISDEQALLAKLRYNRMIDLFLGLTAYSLPNHLGSTINGTNKLNIDEVYIGINRDGCKFIIPVQAKGGSDQLSLAKTWQDMKCCAETFPDFICRPVSTLFITSNRIAIFELAMEGTQVKVADEKHYELVPADQISPADLAGYRSRSI